MPIAAKTSFDQELRELDNAIARISGMAEEQLNLSLEALRLRDVKLAHQVIEGDAKIDALEAEIDGLTVKILMLRNPMAEDLRHVIACLKIASTLERVGDLAKNISRRTLVLAQEKPTRTVNPIIRMGRETSRLLSDTLDAFIHKDKKLATSVWRRDANVDALYNSLVRELIIEMTDMPSQMNTHTHLIFIAKNLERIGDHATFIAEMVYFIVMGTHLQDERPKGVPDWGRQGGK